MVVVGVLRVAESVRVLLLLKCGSVFVGFFKVLMKGEIMKVEDGDRVVKVLIIVVFSLLPLSLSLSLSVYVEMRCWLVLLGFYRLWLRIGFCLFLLIYNLITSGYTGALSIESYHFSLIL